MRKRNNMEQKALRIIMKEGEKGILQSELWRRMNATSREGSRISINLERRGLIRRERELYNGRWTYRLYSMKQLVSIDSIITCPCLTCKDNDRCGPGGKINPNECEQLTQWILESVSKDDPSGGE